MNLFYDCAIIPLMRDRFAEKMKRMIITLLTLIIAACTLSAQKPYRHMKSMLGADVGAILKSRQIKVHAGHQILDRWSAGGWFSIRLNGQTMNQEEEMHRNEFSDEVREGGTDRTGWDSAGLYLQFWTSEIYDGPFISTGIVTDGNGHDDCSLGIGYHMKIWKGLSTSIHLELNIIESFKTQRFKGEGSGLCICYTF